MQPTSASGKVSARRFFISRSDLDSKPAEQNAAAIVIQIRMRNPSELPAGKLQTRKNTEFWLCANDPAPEVK